MNVNNTSSPNNVANLNSTHTHTHTPNSAFSSDDYQKYQTFFKPVSSSTSSIEDAQYILLPEIHNHSSYQFRNAWIIDKLYKEGDIVLVESPKNEGLNQEFFQTKMITRKIEVYGWDCKESNDRIYNSHIKLNDLHEKINSMNYDGTEYIKTLEEAINIYGIPEDNFRVSFLKNPALKLNDKKTIVDLIFLTISSRQQNTGVGEYGRAIIETFKPRQESLVRNCDKFKEAKRVFIIAGARHFEADRSEPEFADGVKILHDYLADKKFVLLDQELSDQTSKSLNDELKSKSNPEPNPSLKTETKKNETSWKHTANSMMQIIGRIILGITLVAFFPVSIPTLLVIEHFSPENYEYLKKWFLKPFKELKRKE